MENEIKQFKEGAILRESELMRMSAKKFYTLSGVKIANNTAKKLLKMENKQINRGNTFIEYIYNGK